MRYRIFQINDDASETEVADLAERAPVSVGVPVLGRPGETHRFTAPRGWLKGAATDAIPGHRIEAYEPPPPPPPPVPTEWVVRLSVIYGRLSTPNKALMRTFLSNDPEKEERFREEGGVLNTNAQVRAWLTSRSEDPDVILGMG